MKVTKTERAAVHAMFDGHCAYCGAALAARWHVDHKDPIIRLSPTTALHPQRHDMSNLFPACPGCNIDKGGFCVEGYREWIVAHLRGLHRQSNFRSVMRHGLVAETNQPVVFYFEKIARERRLQPGAIR